MKTLRHRRKDASVLYPERQGSARLTFVLLLVLVLSMGAYGVVAFQLQRAESRATRRYLRTLELYNTRRDNALRSLLHERAGWEKQGNAWRMAARIGFDAARHGVRLDESRCLEIAKAVEGAATRHSVDPGLILSIIAVESGFDPRAVSPRGAVGLMQLLPSTARGLARELDMEACDRLDLTDPRVNVELGTYYLAGLIRQKKSLPAALTAYNMGPSSEATQSGYAASVRASRRVDL